MNRGGTHLDMKNIYIKLTNVCNLHCQTCDSFINSDKLVFDDVKVILDGAKERGVRQLYLTGGEPLTHKDIYTIIAYAHKLKFHVNMSCNGTLVTDEIVEKLINSGLNNISLSMDGPRGVNDSIRGVGVYDKVLNTLRIFQRFKSSRMVNVLFTVSRSNYKTLLNVVSTVREFGVRQMFLNAFDPSFLVEDKQEKTKTLWILKEELGELEDVLEQSRCLAKDLGVNFPSKEYLKSIIRYFNGETIIPKYGCDIPGTSSSIEVTGQVSGCWKMDTSYSTKNKKITKIWDSEEYQQIVEKAQQAKCPGCLFACYSEENL